ncbi:3-phosphoshikimate 1-carboxyvinyltransferase [Opitutales bacterium ASA1]|uniref:3-phosphoshikimate 1-carboxyvinyltransferase n=1 Tax=Congregicoccus parvus TaxID=3081749 RepID=UPI002B2821DF|nr:3-phosphoshikimate 1-carboxyvinyltransferase [Opitutales bacterium ASA1]
MLADPYPITPFVRPADAAVALPGSKSITNRALLLAALAEGETTLEGALFSEDTAIMADSLRRMGFALETDEARQRITIGGRAGEIPAPEAQLFVGLAGTAARFLTALCCAAPTGTFGIDGVPQMRKRPMSGLLEALRALGARIESAEGFLPLRITASGLDGGAVVLDATSSSQLLSALLMVAPLARAPVRVRLADPSYRREYVTMTLRMMERFGQPPARYSADGLLVEPEHGHAYRSPGGRFAVEPDASAASYFLALPVVSAGRIRLPGIPRDSLQGDTAFAEVIRAVGATIEHGEGGLVCTFPRAHEPSAVRRDFHAISDTFLTLAAIAPLLDGVTRITGIAHTRKQETDRVSGMATELRKLGQHVIEEHDSLEIHPRPLVPHTEIETYHDHRFAMSFAVLGCHDLLGDGKPWLTIRNPACCAKTFPRFFETLEEVRSRSTRS